MNAIEVSTYRNKMQFVVGEDSPAAVIVINCPNRLFMGHGKKEKIDEIRHEDDRGSKFVEDLGSGSEAW